MFSLLFPLGTRAAYIRPFLFSLPCLSRSFSTSSPPPLPIFLRTSPPLRRCRIHRRHFLHPSPFLQFLVRPPCPNKTFFTSPPLPGLVVLLVYQPPPGLPHSGSPLSASQAAAVVRLRTPPRQS